MNFPSVRTYARLVLLAAIAIYSIQAQAATINEVRIWDSPERTRVVFDLSASVNYNTFTLNNPDRIVVDIEHSKFRGKLPNKSKFGPYIEAIRTGKQKDAIRFVFDLKAKVTYKHFDLGPNEIYGDRLVVDIFSASPPKKIERKEKPKTKSEFLVIVDAGHGGEDPGAIGAKKTFEKHLVLQIAKKLKKYLDAQPKIRAELTRTGDYYVPLRRRTQIAIDRDADLFLSIHADAFTRRSANGVSVFALSTKGATSERARLIANKENSSDLMGGEDLSHHDDDVADVLADLALDRQVERSVYFGDKVRVQLSKIAKMHGNYVDQAGFAVLKAPQVPSILVEVGFISNPAEEKKLKTNSYQDRIVKGIGQAVVQFEKNNPWKETKTASN